jgi:hypothetical protein
MKTTPVYSNERLESEESMKLKTPTLSRFAITYGIALVIVAAVAVALFARMVKEVVDPQITPVYSRGPEEKQPDLALAIAPVVMNGEVARTAERIGETTALALATGLYAANEQLHGRTPRTVRDLVAGIVNQNLLPPGLTLTEAEGVLASSCGTPTVNCGALSIRYRPTPLGIEVVSVGSAPDDGPALIVRLPDETSAQGEAALFIATSLTGVKVPDPFAPTAEVIASGWSQERWRSLK